MNTRHRPIAAATPACEISPKRSAEIRVPGLLAWVRSLCCFSVGWRRGQWSAALFILLALLTTPASAVDWAKSLGGGVSGAGLYVLSTAVDSSGNVYMGGYFFGSQFVQGAASLTAVGNQDAFVAKLDSTGSVLWAKSFGGSGASASGQSIAVDNSGNVYLSGFFNNTSLTTPALTKIGNTDAFGLPT